MNKLMAKLFGSGKSRPAHTAPSLPGSQDNPPTIEDGSENATRRQLIQVLLRDVVRKSGIPSHWISCEMLLVSSRTRGHGMYVRLIVRQWDDRLMHYLYAVQKEFLADVERFEPDCKRWLHGLSWQFEVEASCPHTRLPEKSFWAEQVKISSRELRQAAPALAPVVSAEASSASTEQQDAAADLAKLFAIRDNELSKGQGMTAVGYEKTQPSPL